MIRHRINNFKFDRFHKVSVVTVSGFVKQLSLPDSLIPNACREKGQIRSNRSKSYLLRDTCEFNPTSTLLV